VAVGSAWSVLCAARVFCLCFRWLLCPRTLPFVVGVLRTQARIKELDEVVSSGAGSTVATPVVGASRVPARAAEHRPGTPPTARGTVDGVRAFPIVGVHCCCCTCLATCLLIVPCSCCMIGLGSSVRRPCSERVS
jgi:hypothetical protein